MKWFVKSGEEVQGPYLPAEVRKLVRRGLVRPGVSPVPDCSETGLTASVAGSGIASDYGRCIAPGLTQQTPGTEVPVPGVDETLTPPQANAFFFLAGHTLPQPVRLGFTSNRQLRAATTLCP